MAGILVLVLLHISSTMSTKVLSPNIASSWSPMDEDPQELSSEPFISHHNNQNPWSQYPWSQEQYHHHEGHVAPLTIEDILDASSLTSLADALIDLEDREQPFDTPESEVNKRSGALPPKRLGSVVELYRSVTQGLQPFLRTSYRSRNTNSDSRVMRELPSPVFEKPTPVISSHSPSTLVRRSVRRRRRPAACDFRPFTLVCWQTQPNRRKMLNR